MISDPSSNRLANSSLHRPSWYRITSSVALTACLSFICLPALAVETSVPTPALEPVTVSKTDTADAILTKNQEDFYNYCYNGDYKNLQLLLNRKPADLDLNLLCPSGFNSPYEATGLTIASSKGHIQIVQALLKVGADPNKVDNRGFTALMGAAYHGHLNVVQALLKAGADPCLKNKNGIMALDFGINQEITALLQKSMVSCAK
jgi:hypothetical protein